MLKLLAPVVFLFLSRNVFANEAELADLKATAARLEAEKQAIVETVTEIDKAVDEFRTAWDVFADSASVFSSSNRVFGDTMGSAFEQLRERSNWVEKAATAIKSDALSDSQYQALNDEYRRLKKEDRFCDTPLLSSELKSLINSYHAMEKAKKRLKLIESSIHLPHAYEPARNQMKDLVATAERSVTEASKTLTIYATNADFTKVCSVFSNFDVVLVLARAAKASQEAANGLQAISLQSFLDTTKANQDVAITKLETQRFYRGLEGSFLADIRSGNLGQVMLVLGNLDNTIRLVTSRPGFSKLATADRNDLLALGEKTKASISTTAEESGLYSVSGQRKLLQTKSRNVQGNLLKLNGKTLTEPAKSKFATALAYCQSLLGMKTNAVFAVPNFTSTQAALEFDSRLAEAQRLLKEVEQ